MKSYRKHEQCLLTGAKDLEPLKGYEKDYLVKSKSSGFVFCERIPEIEELEKHYTDYPRVTELPALTKKRYAELLDGFEPYRKANNLLDVGCGNGLFLLEAKKRGWNVFGTEFTKDAVDFCRGNGILMKEGPLRVNDYDLEKFDVITSFEVIEHINYPAAESSNFRELLRKGGLLYVTTPNFNCTERCALGPKYDIIEYPEHLCYFTPRTLKLLFGRNGFRTLRIEAVNIDLGKLRGSFKGRIDTNTDGGKMRANVESNPFLKGMKKVINLLLNFLGIGNALKGWFVKE